MALKLRGSRSGAFFNGDERIGVGGVANDQHFYVTRGDLVQDAPLLGKDRTVGFQQVFAFHSFAARARADQQHYFGIAEGDARVVGSDDLLQHGKHAVFQFHRHPAQYLLCRRDIQQLQDDRLLATQHVAIGDAKQHVVSDLSCSAGHGNAYGCFHDVFSGRIMK